MRKASEENVGGNQKGFTGSFCLMGSVVIFFLMAVLYMAPTVSVAQDFSKGSCVGWSYWHSDAIYSEDEKCTEDESTVEIDKIIDINSSQGEAQAEASFAATHRGSVYVDASGRLASVDAWSYSYLDDIFIIGKSSPDAPSAGRARVCYSVSGEVKNIEDIGYVTVWLEAETDNGSILEYYQDVTANKTVSWSGCGNFDYTVDTEVYFSEFLQLSAGNHYDTIEKGEDNPGHAEAFDFRATMTSMVFPTGHYLAYTASGQNYPPKSVRLINPNGGQIINTDETYPITWASDGGTYFDLFYSLDNGLTWNLLENGVTGTSYDWEIPDLTKNKTKCLIRVKGWDMSDRYIGKDQSDLPFTIQVVKLWGPNGGELFNPGDSVGMVWDTFETKRPVYKVKLLYSIDNGVNWKPFASQPPTGTDPEYHLVTIPNVTRDKNKCKVKVVLLDRAGNSLGSDVSDGVFSILKP